jgi:hypothetical protein
MGAIPDAVATLGSTDKILSTFIDFQKNLYWPRAV